MKAWSVLNDDCGYIVYAKTRGKARSMAMGYDGFEYSEWCEIQPHRLPVLDDQRDNSCVLDWQKDSRIYYEAGWYPMDGAPSCDWCSLYEYEEILESHVTETDDGDLVCAACLAHERKEPTNDNN